MSQISLFEPPRFTVTEFTRRVRRLLEEDPALADAWVQGEISNFTRAASGHLYFTLKDSGASLRCVMWKGDALRARSLTVQDGLSFEAHGKIGLYEPSGQYQLIVDLLRPAGEGALFAEFMRLKGLLEAEGLFAPERKRQIPNFPHTIGVITSPTGAALRDILNVLRRRLPLAQVILAATPVQGAEAPLALVQAIQKLNKAANPDVILLARGGGSIEDLWAFNDERVVRAVSASLAPIVTGVGHETDFTLVDFASDLRAPTPTAAAELATPITIADLASYLTADKQRLSEVLLRQLDSSRAELISLNSALRYHSPARRLQMEAQRVDDMLRRGMGALKQHLALEKAHLGGITHRLNSLSPLSILSRGYAVVTRKQDGIVVKSAAQAQEGVDLHVRLAVGKLNVKVQKSFQEEA